MSEIDKSLKELECPHCGIKFVQKVWMQKYCCRKHKCYYKTKACKSPYVAHKKSKCDFCGFIPVDLCQLDVDHIDGNHDNNDPSNLQTLCANCHRLKTKLNKNEYYNKLKNIRKILDN